MGGKKPLRRPLWPPTRATASNYYPLGLDGAGGAAKPLLRAPKKPAPLHGRLPAFSGAVDAFERARKCFLEWRYFFSIILSEFLKNRVALHSSNSLKPSGIHLGMTFSLIPFWTKISLISFPEVITGPGEGYIKELDSTGVSGVKPNCSADHCPTIWKRFAYPATGIVKAAIRQIMVAATSRLLRRNGLLWIDFLQMLFRTGAASFSMG